MAGKNQHVVPYQGDWAVRGAGNSRVTGVYDTKAGAREAGRQIAINQHAELIEHGRDGRIQSKDSFGNDPLPPRDTEH